MDKTLAAGSCPPKRRVMDIKRDLGLELAALWKSTSTISRVAPRQRKLHPEQFKYEHISLGLYDRWDCDTDMPKSHGDIFRLAIVKAFLEDLHKTTLEWDDICKQVVESPQEMQELYDEECHDLPADEVRSVLTLDAMFLASYLGGLFLPDIFGVAFPSAYATLRRESKITKSVLMEDIIMLENQIPLPLIRRAFNLAVNCGIPCVDNESDELFQKLCLQVVRFYHSNMPGCKLSDSLVKIDYQFHAARHLLDCLYLAMCWGVKRERPMDDATRLPHYICGSNAKDVNEADIESHGLSDEFASIQGPAMPLATQLHKAGIEFRGRSDELASIQGPAMPSARQLHKAGIEFRRRPDEFTTIQGAALPSATQLHKAGIEFRGRPGGFRDVEFKEHWFKAILYLPVIPYLGNPCEQLWRNLVALEDHTDGKDEFKAYLELMDDLINTERDVAMMTKGKHPVIVKNGLGSEKAVADLFNSMLNKCLFDAPPMWKALRKQVHTYYSNEARQNRVEFRRTYCGKWWLVVSLAAGGILLVLNVLQFVYRLLSYYP